MPVNIEVPSASCCSGEPAAYSLQRPLALDFEEMAFNLEPR